MIKSLQIKKENRLSSKTTIQMVVDAIAYLYLFLFVYTAFDKVVDHLTFVQSLERYEYIKDYSNVLAWLVIAAEFFISALLLFPRTRKLGLYSALFLMLTFTAGLIFIINTMENAYCSCGGLISSLSSVEHIWFNTGFIVLAIVGIFLSGRKSMNNTPRRHFD